MFFFSLKVNLILTGKFYLLFLYTFVFVDVARWWQSCDRVQRILCKTTLINTSNNNNSNNVNNPTSQTTQLPLNLKNGQQSNTGTIRPRLDIDRPDKIGK